MKIDKKSKLFWKGTPGSQAARVAQKQAEEALQCKMGRARIERRYAELQARSIG